MRPRALVMTHSFARGGARALATSISVSTKVGDWHDTIQDGSDSATVRMQLDTFTGAMAVHCHVLSHEDFGMMALIDVMGEEGTVWPGAEALDPSCYRDGGGRGWSTIGPLTTPVLSPAPALATAAPTMCEASGAQCGGNGYGGSGACCNAAQSCFMKSAKYSQCRKSCPNKAAWACYYTTDAADRNATDDRPAAQEDEGSVGYSTLTLAMCGMTLLVILGAGLGYCLGKHKGQDPSQSAVEAIVTDAKAMRRRVSTQFGFMMHNNPLHGHSHEHGHAKPGAAATGVQHSGGGGLANIPSGRAAVADGGVASPIV